MLSAVSSQLTALLLAGGGGDSGQRALLSLPVGAHERADHIGISELQVATQEQLILQLGR